MAIVGLLKGKTVVITGATSGIGKATALRMGREDATLVLLVRDKKRGEEIAHMIFETRPTADAEVVVCDLKSQASVRKAAQEVLKAHPTIDVLVNVAGVYKRERNETPDGVEEMWATNHFGPFLLTNLLLPALKKAPNGRVLTVSSPSTTKIDFDQVPAQKEFKAGRVFGATKSANILFGLELARRLKGTTTTSNVVHPGLIRSNLMREAPKALQILRKLVSKNPQRAAEILVLLAASKPLGAYSGRFYKKFAPVEAPTFSRDPQNQKRLWELSAKVTGLKGA
jgi:NAD(P)-dependent dehydrogenase (short-subunit alcohol dehydrogenase family)